MNVSTAVDITSAQLHKLIQSYRQAHPHIEDVEALVDAAIHERWPAANPFEVAYSALVNQANEDFDKIVRDAARKTEEWIDTTVQGDLFSTLPPVRVPKYLTDAQGQRIPYWKASPEDVIAFLQARAEGLTAEIGALQETLSLKERQRASIQTELAKHLRIREVARQNGIQSSEVRYERRDD